MNISELEAVVSVELYGSYIGAAKHTGTPISTLSKRISRAEEELGFLLFERKTTASSVSMTEQGAALMPQIHTLLSANSSMFNVVQNLLGKNAYTLVVGRPPLLGDFGDSELIADFMAKNIDMELVSVIRSHAELLRLLMECRLECAFFLMIGSAVARHKMWEMFQTEQYSFSVLRESTEMYIGISESDPLAQADSVSISELRDYTFIFNKWHDGLGAQYGRGPAFFEYLNENKKNFKLILEDFMNTDYVYRLVALGKYVVPQAFPDKYKVPGISFLKVKGWKQSTSVVFIARKYRSGALKKFTDYIENNAGVIQPGNVIFNRTE